MKRRDYSAAIAAYNAGASLGDIGRAMGISRQAVWDALRRRGVVMRKHVQWGDRNHFYRGEARSTEAAKQAVKRAIKSGRLVKTSCECCGSNDNIRGHHDDYGKPLVVRWLCASCHFDWHTKHRAKLPEGPPTTPEQKAAA
jgi:transposase-like protein